MTYSVIKKNPFYKIYFSLNLGKNAVLTQSDFKSGMQQYSRFVYCKSFSDSLQICSGEAYI